MVYAVPQYKDVSVTRSINNTLNALIRFNYVNLSGHYTQSKVQASDPRNHWPHQSANAKPVHHRLPVEGLFDNNEIHVYDGRRHVAVSRRG